MADSIRGAVPPRLTPDPIPVPAGLVDRAAHMIGAVLAAVRHDTRLVRPERSDELPAPGALAAQVLTWAVGDPYASERETAGDVLPQYAAEGFERAERTNVNAADLATGDRLPGAWRVAAPPAEATSPREAAVTRGAQAALAAVAPPVEFDRADDGAVTVRAGDRTADTVFGVVGAWAQPLVLPLAEAGTDTGENARQLANRAFGRLNPWRMVAAATDPARTLDSVRREFFRDWARAADGGELDAFWEANHWPGRWNWARAEPGAGASPEAVGTLDWEKLAWPGRAGDDHNHLDPWLHDLLFLGAGTAYVDGHRIERDLGRSLVVRRLGFRSGSRAVCSVCGRVEPLGAAEHRCPGIPAWERRPVFVEQFHVGQPGGGANLRPYVRCRNTRGSAGAELDLTAAHPFGDHDRRAPAVAHAGADVQPRRVNGKAAGLWLTPTAAADSAARLKFEAGPEVTGATVQVWSFAGADPHLLAAVTLAPQGRGAARAMTAQVVRAAPTDPARPACEPVSVDRGEVVVPLLYNTALVALTERSGKGAIFCKLAFKGCEHLWEPPVTAEDDTPITCPRCGGRPGAKRLRLWVHEPHGAAGEGALTVATAAQQPVAAAPAPPPAAPVRAAALPAGTQWEVTDLGDGTVEVQFHFPSGIDPPPRRMSREQFENWLAQQGHVGGADGWEGPGGNAEETEDPDAENGADGDMTDEEGGGDA